MEEMDPSPGNPHMTTSSNHPKTVHRRYASRRIPEAAVDLTAATASGGMAVARRRRLEDG